MRFGVRYLVLAWFCALATLAYIHRGCIAVPSLVIQQDLRISEADMGAAMGMFFWGYACMQLPSGWWAQAWGSRLLVPILVLAWSGCTGLLGFAAGFLSLAVFRCLMGAAQAGIFPCAVQSFARWFPTWERGFPSGVLGSFMSVGAIVGSILTGFLLKFFDWTWVFVLLALPGILAALGFWWWYRDRPEDHAWVSPAELNLIHGRTEGANPTATKTTAPDDDRPWWTLLLRVTVLLVMVQQFFRAAAYNFYMTWFPRFLQNTREVDDPFILGLMNSLPLAGVVLGATTGGALADWLYRRTGSLAVSRKGLAIVTLLFAALFLCLGYLIEDALATVAVISVGSFFAGTALPLSYVITIDIGGKNIASCFGLMNMSGNIGAAVFPTAMEAFASAYGWEWAPIFVGALYLPAVLAWLCMRLPKHEHP